MNNTIYVLLDYDGRFYSEWDKKEFDLAKFIDNLSGKGFKVIPVKFCDIDFKSMDFRGSIVVYSSSEVGHYKDFIEDVLLGISFRGGVLIPNYYLFRAHHNKSFQEIYKKVHDFGNLEGISFGALVEFAERSKGMKWPVVLKSSDDSGSKNVFLGKSYSYAMRKAKKLSSSFDSIAKQWFFQARAAIAAKLGIRDKERIYRNNARKFVVQDYISGLENDWKILIFGNRFYALNRKVRKGDFRASGSGRFAYTDCPAGLLDFAEDIFNKMDAPYAAFDIAFDGTKYYLLEFQALYFGLYTVLNAEYYYEKENGSWGKRAKTLSIEEEISDSIANYVKDKSNVNGLDLGSQERK